MRRLLATRDDRPLDLGVERGRVPPGVTPAGAEGGPFGTVGARRVRRDLLFRAHTVTARIDVRGSPRQAHRRPIRRFSVANARTRSHFVMGALQKQTGILPALNWVR